MIYVRAAGVRTTTGHCIRKKMLEWCEQNCRAEWTKWPTFRTNPFGLGYGLYYGFANPNEAMMFKMVWG